MPPGETARRRDDTTARRLTAAGTAGRPARSKKGMSNKDVAAQLFVSPRTVDFHLRNVFTKTGVSSRGELIGLDLE